MPEMTMSILDRHALSRFGGLAAFLSVRRLGLAWVLLVITQAAPALGAGWTTFQVDDSQSQLQTPYAQLRWRELVPTRETSNALSGRIDVRIVLNTMSWVGRQARIYMVMPPLPQSSLSVSWTTSGTLLPGQLAGGQRQLVFQGVVPGPRIEDFLRVVIASDARDPVTPSRVSFTFEIEVPK